MTTIVYRAGVLAGDGRQTFIEEGESAMIDRDDCVKVHRLPDGRLFGGAKTSEDINVLYDALTDGRAQMWPAPKLEDINAMVIDVDGSIHVYEGARWDVVNDPYYAVGSGSRFAFPALDAGATAVRAVEIGIKRDPFSGGKITTLDLRPSERFRPKSWLIRLTGLS